MILFQKTNLVACFLNSIYFGGVIWKDQYNMTTKLNKIQVKTDRYLSPSGKKESSKMPRAVTPSKIAHEAQRKNKSWGCFLFNSCAQWNCYIRGCFALFSKWLGLCFYILYRCKYFELQPQSIYILL